MKRFLHHCLNGLKIMLGERVDQTLLAAVSISLIAMIAYLSWPTPQASIVLQPYSAPDESTLTLSPELLPAVQDDETHQLTPTKKKSKKATRAKSQKPKKPAVPPITNINTATQAQLELLPGIGPKMAERIVTHRKTQGAFQRIEQIQDVKGIGEKKFEALKPYLKI